jgi:hypothetical protein
MLTTALLLDTALATMVALAAILLVARRSAEPARLGLASTLAGGALALAAAGMALR